MGNVSTRVAKCHCGKLKLETKGEPRHIFQCHCKLCQRRTGTNYGLGAWFSKTDIVIRGQAKKFIRKGESGSESIFYFCPNCGSNLYWECFDKMPSLISVAVGCFADPSFPTPTTSVFGKSRHHWVTQLTGIPRYLGSTESELE